MAKSYRLGRRRRALNRLIKTTLRLRIAPKGYALLTVRGRRTGQEHSTPVRPVEHAGSRWVVAPYGPVGWVRNARAADGEATLTVRGRTQRVRLVECDAHQAAPVLQTYIRLVPVTRPYFDAGSKDSVEQFAVEASAHPVFRIAERD